MAGTYIAGYDGSAASRAAVRFAAHLARATSARVIAANVYPTIENRVLADVPEDRRLSGRAGAEQLLAELDEDVIRRPVEDISVDLALCELAFRKRASLLAVGVTHRGKVGRVVLGSVSDLVLRSAPCSVAVVPAGWRPRDFGVIAVAYDGEPESRVALAMAQPLAAKLGARVLVLGVADQSGAVSDALAAAAAQLPVRVDARVQLLAGSPGPVLLEACDTGVDLLVAGARARGRLRRVFLGSVSRRLVNHAACPTLVVPAAASFPLVGAELAAAA